jgi:4-amino-4-deoxy-L-arabinose transferase-like glycosyltransferase
VTKSGEANTGQQSIAARRVGDPSAGIGVLIAILVAAVILSVLFAISLPMDAKDPNPPNPDELSHFSYIRLLAEHRGFVKFVPDDPAYFETHQPPLYYLLCLPVYLATGGNYVAVRLVAILFQLGTIFVTFRACRDFFPDRVDVALGAAAFVAFLPSAAQLGGAINNDPLTTLLCALIFWKLGKVAMRGSTPRKALLLGAIFGIGLLTKLSVLQLLPTFCVAYLIAVRWRVMPLKQAVVCLGTALAVGFLVASPWLIRNTILYGDPFTLKIFPLTAGPEPPNPERMMRLMGWTFDQYLSITAVRTFATFWFILPPLFLNAAPWALALALLFAVGGLWGAISSVVQGRREGMETESGAVARLVKLFVCGIILLVPFFTKFIFTFFQAQGRYFFPALLPIAVLTVLGFANLPGRAGKFGVLILVMALLVMSLFQVTTFGKGFAA